MIINQQVNETRISNELKKEGRSLKEHLEKIIQEVKFMSGSQLFYNTKALMKFVVQCLENLDKSKYVRNNLPKLVGYLYEKSYIYQMDSTNPIIQYVFETYQQITELQIPYIFDPDFRQKQINQFISKKLYEEKETLYEMCAQQKKFDLKVKAKIKAKVKAKNTKMFNPNNFIQKMGSQLPNPIYPCCSPFFYYKWRVSQINASQIQWVGLSEHAAKRQMEISKAICAIANRGGGVVLAGIDRAGMVKGMKITESMKDKYEQAIVYWKNSIYPQNLNLQMNFIPVFNSQCTKQVETQGLYVMKVKVKVNNQKGRQMHYVRIQKQGFVDQFQTYLPKGNHKLQRLEGLNLYEQMHYYFYINLNKKRHSHLSQPCKKPASGNPLYEEGDEIYEIDNFDTEYEQQDESQEEKEKQIKVQQIPQYGNFNNRCIISTGPSKEYTFEIARKKLQNITKGDSRILKIFPQLQDPSGRQLRLAMFNVEERIFNNVLKQTYNLSKNQRISNVVKVAKGRFTSKLKDTLEKKFQKSFLTKEYSSKPVKGEKGKEEIRLSFSDEKQSIFAYMYLEMKLVNPQFHQDIKN